MLPTVVTAPPTASLHQELPLVSPVASNEKILQSWQNFQELKVKLLEPSDFAEVKGEKLAKKSAFRKLALAFGISTELVNEDRIELKDGMAYLVTMRAISPSGRFMTALASCHSDERKFTKASDVRAIAETRATNRAIANLIGWSAPSAEEVMHGGIAAAEAYPETASPAPVEDPTGMTPRQRGLLVQLITRRYDDPDDRERALGVIEGLSKADASQFISEMIRQNAD